MSAVKQRKLGVSILAACALGACAVPSGTTTTSKATSTATTSNTSSCTKTVIDRGIKGTVAAVVRGTYSSTAIRPDTSTPATAYTDPGTLTLKMAFWDGTGFSVETVAADSGGPQVKLVFLPTSIPIILWSQGINLKAAIRSAALTASGTWSAAVIDTGTAPRAVEAAVNPLGQVGVIFATGTLATERIKFLYCDAPCSNATSFQAMSVTPFIENVNITATPVNLGLSWCKASSSQYYPAVSYGVAAAVRYGVCQNTLANCLTNTNWSLQNIVASASVSTRLVLSSSTVGDVPRAVALSGAGIVPYRMGATACTSAPAAFSAGTALGGATSGSQMLSLLTGSNGKFHVYANEGAVSVRYYNSQTTDIIGTWNTAGVIETIALAAAHGGGAAIDTATDSIYGSYPSGAAPFDIRLGRVVDSTVASNAATFGRYDIDKTGGIQLSAAASQQLTTALTVTSAGKPAVAYVDYSVGAVAQARLKYALRNGSSATSSWPIETVPGTQNPQHPDLRLDAGGRPWISYFDAANNRFYLANNGQSDGSGSWQTFEFPATPGGAPAALPAANNTALAMYYSGGNAYPVMGVIDTNAGTRGVIAARFDPTTFNWSAPVTIDALGGAAAGSHLSMDSDSSGNVILGYRDLVANRVKYSYSSNGTSWTAPLGISALSQGAGLSLRINPATSRPMASYYDRAANLVMAAECTGSLAGCATGGWSNGTVDSGAGVSGLATTNEQLLSTAISFSNAGVASIIYGRGAGASGNLMSATGSGSSWTLTTLAESANGALSGAPALNFAAAGWNPAASRNGAGGIVSAYIGPGNWLYAVSCGD